MINNCNEFDKDKIYKLGSLINSNFRNVNNIDGIINNNEIIGYYLDKELVGFIIFKKLYEIVDLLYIVVEPLYRKKGIATSLMDYFINNVDCEKIMLEVNVTNKSAIKLYKKYDFKIINIRDNYYDNDSAYVMELIK